MGTADARTTEQRANQIYTTSFEMIKSELNDCVKYQLENHLGGASALI